MASGLENIETIESPFRRFVTTIGVFPTAFTDAMTYYECLAYLVKYLEDTVVPAVNENAEALKELQDYVVHYFDNLDVQDEINNKLDQMAEDGTLQEIIASYIQANVAWTFETVADMKSATNLVAGSYARTLGFHTINDGGGATYYITDTGTADEKAVIAVGDLFANIAPDKIVSPEQYGAYGDGTHDDTTSWQLAVNSGRAVLAKPTTYLCGKIEVTENISIDCNHAKFICNADTLFEVKGEVVTTLTSQTNYTANNQNYVIADGSYSAYTGYAVLKGDNNFQESRDYYKGGFVAEFKSGKMNGSYPIPVTNTSIDIVTPITGELKNIDGLTHTSPSITTVSINVIYGLGYKVSNVCEKSASGYKFIQLSYCMNCICDNLTVMQHFESDNNNSYIVDFDNSSFCSVLNSTLHNDLWHDITTGGYYLCYCNLVQNCHLTSNTQYAYLDHENARGTTVKDSTVQCVGVAGLGTVENVIVIASNDTYKRCVIRVCPVSDRVNAIYKFRNCHLITEGSNINYCGVKLQNSPQVTGKTYYVEKVIIENLTAEGGTTPTLSFLTDADSYCVIKDMNVVNSMINCSLKPSTHTYEDVSNAILTIENCNYQYGSHFMNIGGSGTAYNKVVINNSKVWRIYGTITTLELNNIETETSVTGATVTATNLYGSGIKSFLRQDLLLAATNLMISDMYHNANDKWFNICNDDTKKYYTHLDNGAMTTVEVTYP